MCFPARADGVGGPALASFLRFPWPERSISGSLLVELLFSVREAVSLLEGRCSLDELDRGREWLLPRPLELPGRR